MSVKLNKIRFYVGIFKCRGGISAFARVLEPEALDMVTMSVVSGLERGIFGGRHQCRLILPVSHPGIASQHVTIMEFEILTFSGSSMIVASLLYMFQKYYKPIRLLNASISSIFEGTLLQKSLLFAMAI